jgi:hypothetical protein
MSWPFRLRENVATSKRFRGRWIVARILLNVGLRVRPQPHRDLGSLLDIGTLDKEPIPKYRAALAKSVRELLAMLAVEVGCAAFWQYRLRHRLQMEAMMDKKIAGLLGAVGALASLGTAQGATPSDPTEVLKARSYADLLEPIPGALAALKAVDEAATTGGDNVQVAQYAHHHHHHHHHHSYRGDRRIVVMPRRHHHHHHHHHHSVYVR